MTTPRAHVQVLDEPSLEFRYGQELADPRDGLSLFGPFDADSSSHRRSLTYGVIGTDEGISLFNQWSKAMSRAWISPPKMSEKLWPTYPGFEAAFCSAWPSSASWESSLDVDKLLDAASRQDPSERAYLVVNTYLDRIAITEKLHEKPDVLVCVVPDDVHRNCRAQSRVSEPTGEPVTKEDIKQRTAGQMELFNEFVPEQYKLSVDFRRQIKARAMEHGIPIQIIRESTLRLTDEWKYGERRLTPLSNRMWNLSTAFYYKGCGRPWRLASARDGVCYIGIAFRRATGKHGNATACCAAQMFLNSGDGIVFLGEYGPWYSPDNKQFRLSVSAAESLLRGVLKTYTDLGGKPLKEVFLHSRSGIARDEFDGYSEACPVGVKLVGVRVRSLRDGPRLYRQADRPAFRGTFWEFSETRGYLFASGFKARAGTYDGVEVPAPLQIDLQHGSADLTQVAKDILGLTKLNYNACKLGDAQPVTVGYSDAVGEILVSNPTVTKRNPNFKFYI